MQSSTTTYRHVVAKPLAFGGEMRFSGKMHITQSGKMHITFSGKMH